MKKQSINEKIIDAVKTQFPNLKISIDLAVGCAVVANDHLFVCSETVAWDTDRYSRSYNRKFGGAKLVSDRQVTIYEYCSRKKKQKLQLADIIYFDSWRGNILGLTIKSSSLF